MDNFLLFLTKFSSSDSHLGFDSGAVFDDVYLPRNEADDAQINSLFNTIYFWAGIICVGMIIYGGILYTTSQSDQSKVTAAKNSIMYAIVGLIIVAIAFLITNFVLGEL